MEWFNSDAVHDQLSSIYNTCESMDKGYGGHCNANENSKKSQGIDSRISDFGYCKDSSSTNNLIFFEDEQESFLRNGVGDESRYNILSPTLHSCLEEISEIGEIWSGNQKDHQHKKIGQKQFAPASLELLKAHARERKRLDQGRVIHPTIDPPSIVVLGDRYSAEQIMRIAAKRFMEPFNKTIDVVSMLENPFEFSLAGVPDEDSKKVELAELLMASAQKVGEQQNDHARMLLNRCDELSSSTGNAVERTVYYFSKALQERIDQETRERTYQGFRKQQLLKIDEEMALNPAYLAVYQEVPFTQIAYCTGIQAIIENVTKAKKIHVIDLGIRIGVQWTGLMQALVSDSGGWPFETLKITAVGTGMKSLIEDTGKRLTSFAESISLPFSFNVVMVSDVLELHEDRFDVDADETVVVFSAYLLKRMIPEPDRLDYMMKVIRILNPSIMVVTEPELNSISTSFVNRLVETIFYFSAYFDSFECCMGDNPNRVDIEHMLFGEGIRNIVATERAKRNIRHAKLDVWRVFFARYGMAETQLSTASLLHGKLMAAKLASGNACTLEPDGRSLLIGWKGTPLISLSAWKFKI